MESGSHFRPDVQGLRAVAVGLVILAHAGFATLAGGFVGVDVFFVISGYLITSLLVREAARTGHVSLLGFYARRARRILPVAVLVTVVTVVLSVLVLPPVRALEVAKDAVWSSAFLGNVRFASVGTDYFAQGEAASPLQHFWSLAVEEQYYLVWPLVVIAVLAALDRARRRRRVPVRVGAGDLRGPLLVILAVAIALSLAWSIYGAFASPTQAYFSTLTRAWELGVGSATAVLLGERAPQLRRGVRGWLVGGGLLAVLAAALTMTADTRFPGYAAALPVLGTAAVIVGGAGGLADRPGVLKLLTNAPARLVGDWSYSLYLWHWPVLLLAEEHYGVRRLPLDKLALALALVLVLSVVTHYGIDLPIRRGTRLRRPLHGVVLYPVGLALVVATALGGRTYLAQKMGEFSDAPAISAGQFQGAELDRDPAIALVEASVLAAQAGQEVPGDLQPSLLNIRAATAPLGDCDYRTGTRELCPVGDTDAERTLVLFGDSHARAWSPGVAEAGRRAGYKTYILTFSGCPASAVEQVDIDSQRVSQDCEDWKDWAEKTLSQLHPDVVVVAAAAVSPITGDTGSPIGLIGDGKEFKRAVVSGLGAELDLLTRLAGRVVLLADTPQLPREPGVCLSSGDVDLGNCLFPPGPGQHRIQMRFLDEARARGIEVVDAQRWFCADGFCPSVVGRTVTFRDREHMTPQYAVTLAVPLLEALGLD